MNPPASAPAASDTSREAVRLWRAADAVRRWGRLRDPAGYPFRAGLHGYYRRDPLATGAATAALIHAAEVPALLDETRERMGGRPALIWVDRRPRDAALGPALRAAACAPVFAATYLLHDGRPRRPPTPLGLTLEAGRADTVAEFVAIKSQAFGNLACPPSPALLDGECRRRAWEFEQGADFLLARDRHGHAVGVVSWYRDADARLLNLLAVQRPWRRRGVGSWLVQAMLARCRAQGAECVMVVPEPACAGFYQRHGFSREAAWRRAYRLLPGKSREASVKVAG